MGKIAKGVIIINFTMVYGNYCYIIIAIIGNIEYRISLKNSLRAGRMKIFFIVGVTRLILLIISSVRTEGTH